MEQIMFVLLGVAIGWITKVPWLLKVYREFGEEKRVNERMRNFFKELGTHEQEHQG